MKNPGQFWVKINKRMFSGLVSQKSGHSITKINGNVIAPTTPSITANSAIPLSFFLKSLGTSASFRRADTSKLAAILNPTAIPGAPIHDL